MYVIVDIHPEDACYDVREIFLGNVGLAKDLHQSIEGDGYVAGWFEFVPSIQYEDSETKHMYFYAVQLQSLEDNEAENGKMLQK